MAGLRLIAAPALALALMASPAFAQNAYPWNVRGADSLKLYTSQTGDCSANAICTICVDRSTRLYASITFGGVQTTSTIPNRGCAAFATSGNQDIVVRCKMRDDSTCPDNRVLEGLFICTAE